MPTAALVGVGVAIPALLGGLWWLVATLLGADGRVTLAGPAGAAVAGGCAVVSLLVLGPWRTRALSLWMSLWLAGTLVRLVLTPLATYLLYSATRLDGSALGISVGSTYLVTLLIEAAVLSRCLNRAVIPPS